MVDVRIHGGSIISRVGKEADIQWVFLEGHTTSAVYSGRIFLYFIRSLLGDKGVYVKNSYYYYC